MEELQERTAEGVERRFEKISAGLLARLTAGEELTVQAQGEASQFLRLNRSRARQTGFVEEGSLLLAYIAENRTARAGLMMTDDWEQDLASAIEQLERLRAETRQLPEDPYLVRPSGGPSSRRLHAGALLPPLEVCEAILPAMEGADLAGIYAAGMIFVANANSAGRRHFFSTESFHLDYSLVTPDERMVKGTFAGTVWDQNEYEAHMRRSREQLQMLELPARVVAPGAYRVFLAPAAVADLVGMFSWGCIGEACIRRAESPLIRAREEGVRLSPLFNLSEDFRDGTVPCFNDEGETAPEHLPLFTNGVLTNTLVSSRTAKEYGIPSNQASSHETMRAPSLEGGTLAEEDVLAALGTGLYLSNLHYLNWSDRQSGRITGMTRYACFLVEEGRIVAPIENMRFDDSLFQCFGANLEALTAKTEWIGDVDTYDGRKPGGIRVPGALVNDFMLTL